jgi:alpha-glucosidase (family GH31 glycosyl hydrolase)
MLMISHNKHCCVSATMAIRLVLVLCLGPCVAAAGGAEGTTTVVSGKARFQFLTPSLVRLEWSPAGTFTDAPTAVVQRRDWRPVQVAQREEGGWLMLASDTLTLRYRVGSGEFTPANLSVSWNDRSGAAHHWHPGEADPLNLGGLTYSLDNVSQANLLEDATAQASPRNDEIPGIDLVLPKATPGLLSRSGYGFIDDSPTPVLNGQRTWIEPRAQPRGQDWYLFVYGHDYRRVLREYAQLCGSIPMIPRFVLGVWITDLNFEYFPGSAESQQPQFQRYNQHYLLEEVARMRREHIPFDTLVLDFAWHNYGWQGGYDWSPLIPQPQQLIRSLQAQGVKLSLNDHPGYIHTDESILSYDDSHAAAVLQALGRPPPRKPAFEMDLSRGWSFARDPQDVGLGQHWYRGGAEGVSWHPIRTGLSWEKQGFADYHGVGWYRASVQLPAKLPSPLYLDLGEVSSRYRLFVNGREAMHSYDHWPRRLTYADIAPYVSAAQRAELMLRVEGDPYGSGILRGPVVLRDISPPERIAFDLSAEKQADIFMRYLHAPLMDQGVDVWWVDGGSGATNMAGLNPQLWTNKVFYDFSQQHTGKRAFILGRYGDWGSQRYPGFFTGDTYSEWPVLAYEVAFSARGGNVLMPYISHDIGGFHGGKIDFGLYARWVEFGAFSAILRLHSAHENPREGNLRMPWVYGERGIELARKYFTLRTQLIPYLYTYSWLAHRDSTPLLRPLYLEYPELDEAYRHPYEYFLGAQLLVAPVVRPGTEQEIYLPPGDWRDFFTGKPYHGGRTFSAHYALDATPVFVREGAVIAEQAPSEYSNARPLDHLVLKVFGSAPGSFELYEDDGTSLDYDSQHAHTAITHTSGEDGSGVLVIGPTQGGYPGQPVARSYELWLQADARPSAITVDGRQMNGWRWDPQRSTAVVMLSDRSIHEGVHVEWR